MLTTDGSVTVSQQVHLREVDGKICEVGYYPPQPGIHQSEFELLRVGTSYSNASFFLTLEQVQQIAEACLNHLTDRDLATIEWLTDYVARKSRALLAGTVSDTHN